MKIAAFVCSCVISQTVYGQSTSFQKDSIKPGVFRLGEVEVISRKTGDLNSTINAGQLRAFAKNDVSSALNILPGINLSAVGPRNEAMVYIRGFDLRQVPLLIDGIPVYIPYDGYVDLARFTTFDLSAVQVSKGYTSVLYGPNAMGGAINLISRRPEKPFEFNGATGWQSGGYRSDINIGSNLGKFYIQAGASKLKRDSFPLSDKFVPGKNEDGGDRNNSWSTDEKYNIKVAYTPNQRSEYALSYIYQHGKKGTPVYTGTDTLNSQFKSPRYWRWPYWDKRSLYFISNTVIDSSQYVKTRFYYDKFKNELDSYDDATYTTISRPYAFKSFYDDYSLGGIVEYGKTFSRWDDLKATVQYKRDVHRENNEGEPVRTMSDRTFTAGIENVLTLTRKLTLLTGFSYNNRTSIKAEEYNSTAKEVRDLPSNNNNAFNVQGGLRYQLSNDQLFHLSVARKTRFATMKDRYSYRMGTAIPNPDLKAEYTVNYEAGYSGRFAGRFELQAALFYSKIHNTILSVSNVKLDTTRNVWQSQLQNVGESEYLGGEIGLNYQISASFNAGANYTYIKRNNLTNPKLYFTDVPQHKLFGFVQYQFRDRLSLQVNAEHNSSRYSTTYGMQTDAFTLLNTTATVHVWRWFSVEGGINNIADKNYSLVEGYPEPGRNYFANVIYRL
jgi:iron complex outermembrane receptor protein